MLAFPSNHYKDKIRSRKSTPKLSAYVLITANSKVEPYIKNFIRKFFFERSLRMNTEGIEVSNSLLVKYFIKKAYDEGLIDSEVYSKSTKYVTKKEVVKRDRT